MRRTVKQCRDRGCQDLILIPGEFGYRCKHSGETPSLTKNCNLDNTHHPVHFGDLPPSAKNCEGCSFLLWQDESPFTPRRRNCMCFNPARIPGNLKQCPFNLLVAGKPFRRTGEALNLDIEEASS